MLKHKKPATVNKQRGRSDIPKCCADGFPPVNSSEDVGKRRSLRLSRLSETNNGESPSRKPTGGIVLNTNANGKPLYPKYLLIPEITYRNTPSRVELAKGSLCKMIVELWDEGETLKETLVTLKHYIRTTTDGFDSPAGFYTTEDINAIRTACCRLGLGKSNELEADFEDYENESIEGWWIESHWETELRREPISRDVYAGKGDEWWTKREKARHREWERFKSPDIGARKHKFTKAFFSDLEL